MEFSRFIEWAIDARKRSISIPYSVVKRSMPLLARDPGAASWAEAYAEAAVADNPEKGLELFLAFLRIDDLSRYNYNKDRTRRMVMTGLDAGDRAADLAEEMANILASLGDDEMLRILEDS